MSIKIKKTQNNSDQNDLFKMEANKNSSNSIKIDHGLQCWLVVAACSLINFILFGIYRSYALLYTALLENYHINRTQAAWPFSLCMTIIHLTGPISGLLNSKFSIRTIYATGCFFSTLGIGLCYFATEVTDISLYIGVVQGFGIGLTYVQSVAILSEYFTKKLGIANGISMAGGTVGPFLLSPLLNWFLNNYKLKSSFLMLTLITLLTLPLCIILKHNQKRSSNKFNNKFNNCFKSSKSFNLKNNLSLKCNSNLPSLDNKLNVNLKSFQTLNELDTTHQTIFNQTDNERQKSINLTVLEDQLTNSISKHSLPSLFIIDYNQDHSNGCQQSVRTNFFSILKKQLSKFRSSERVNSIKTLKSTNNSKNSNISFTIQNLLSVISSVYFLLIMYTHLAYFWAIITYQMVIVDFSMDCNIPKYLANNMITSFSLGDLCGRLGSGWIIDRKYCANKHYFLACSLLIAILLNVLNFVKDYYGLLLITMFLGMLAGMIVILINVCLCEYLGKNKASLAFGLSAFCCGLATLARPNLVGYFRDIQGSYNGLFNLLSVLCYIACLFWTIEILITRIKIKQKLTNSGLDRDL